jgi:hypothetical protein
MPGVSAIFKLCTPALIYLVLSVVVLVMAVFSGISAMTLIIKSMLIVLWTFLLNWLCSHGMGTLAWVILLLPVVLILLMASWSTDLKGYSAEPVMTATSLGSSSGCTMCGAH